MSDERQEICDQLHSVVGEDGCGVSCSETEFFREDGEWKLFLAGFMEPWPMGRTVAEVKSNLKEYAAMGFGLG